MTVPDDGQHSANRSVPGWAVPSQVKPLENDGRPEGLNSVKCRLLLLMIDKFALSSAHGTAQEGISMGLHGLDGEVRGRARESEGGGG